MNNYALSGCNAVLPLLLVASVLLPDKAVVKKPRKKHALDIYATAKVVGAAQTTHLFFCSMRIFFVSLFPVIHNIDVCFFSYEL